MTAISTGIAGSVAQTSLQAQQVAHQRDRQVQAAGDAKRLREQVSLNFQALIEGDQGDGSAVRIDEQLPEHQSPPQERRRQPRQRSKSLDITADEQAAAPAAPAGPDSPLYRHLDVSV